MPLIAVSPIKQTELPVAATVLTEAFLGNPIKRAVHGPDESMRRRRLSVLFERILARGVLELEAAYVDEHLVGVAAMAPFARCRPPLVEQASFMPRVMSIGLPSLIRFAYCMARWAGAEPNVPHRHLQLLGVEPRWQGQGIGSRLLDWYCELLDARGELAYHETDKPENVVFYGRRGYQLDPKPLKQRLGTVSGLLPSEFGP